MNELEVESMGLFDSWRRKKRTDVQPTRVKGREIMTSGTHVPEPERTPLVDALPVEEQNALVALVAEYERLYQRREELQNERSELTIRLDNGELTALEFRKELMNRIQEAAAVSDKLKETAAKLTSMGYKGVLH